MTNIPYLQVTEFAAAVMQSAGCAPGEARAVATRLVSSTLAGHASHGVQRVPKYLDWVADDTLRSNQHASTVFDAGAVIIVEGDQGFGQVIGEEVGQLGVPRANGKHVILDMTSSMAAEGKLMVAMNKGESVPEGWIIDKDGKPTTNPKDFYDGGSLLTGGAHMGSGLSVSINLLSGALTDGRSSDPDDPVLRNNMLSIYTDPGFYDKTHGIAQEIDRFVEWVKASPAAVPGQPVLAPGDIERRNAQTRKADGVPLDDTTIAQLREAAKSIGVSVSA